ncbi:MAG: xanthine dehydrogenase family protein subunit M [Parvibaculaceae bacterium]
MYLRPGTVEEAVAALASSGARVLAGGTDFYPALGDKPVRQPVLDITAIADLAGISTQASQIRIGARTRWTEIAKAELPPAFDGLKAAAREVGSIQIQNAGTIGGNLCNASPAADGVPPLLTLDASVELASPRGLRRLKLGEFILGNRRTALASDEIMTAVLIPEPHGKAKGAFLKLGSRRYLVISIAMVAVIVTVEEDVIADARIAIGACSAVAQRLAGLEADLLGKPVAQIGEFVEARHLTSLAPIDDVRATASYRKDAAPTLIRRTLEEAVA